MISVMDWVSSIDYTEDFKLPDKIDKLFISVDNGRLGISINGVQVFYTLSLQDGNVEITKE